MMMFRPQHSRYWLCLLVLLALAVQAMIPLGFMPGQKSGKMVEIVICTDSGLSTIMVDDAPEKSDQNHQSDAATHCPYAPVLASGIPHQPPVLHVLFFEMQYRLTVVSVQPADIPSKNWLSQAPPAPLTHT